MRIGQKITLIGSCVTLAIVILTTICALWLNNSLVKQSQDEINQTMKQSLSERAQSINSSIMQFNTGAQSGRDAARKAIMDMKVGKTGYVWIIQGSGEKKGAYIISKDGKRDGESIWNSKDDTGTYFIQEIVNKAVTLKNNETFTYRYMWKNQGEQTARAKIAAVSYYEPWDWVIGVSSYEDELAPGLLKIQSAGSKMVIILLSVGLGSAIIGSILLFLFGASIGKKMKLLSQAAVLIGEGDIERATKLFESKVA